MLAKVKSWIERIIRLFTTDKENNDNQGFITIGEIIPREIKIRLYQMVS